MASTPVELRSPSDSAAAPSALWQADVGQGTLQLSLADPAVLGMQLLSKKFIL